MLGERLKEERERLGFTIPQFAELAGAKKNTVIDWQNGMSSPPAIKLAALAGIGVDVLYVITGRREGSNASTSTDLPSDERKLLKRYRALGELQRKQALDMLQVLALGGSSSGHTNIVKGNKAGSLNIGSIHGGAHDMKPDKG